MAADYDVHDPLQFDVTRAPLVPSGQHLIPTLDTPWELSMRLILREGS